MSLSQADKCAIIASSLAPAEDRALDWIVERVNYFNPLYCSDSKTFDKTIKPLAELALTCAIASHSRGNADIYRYKELARYIWESVFLNEAFREHLLIHAAGGFAYSLFGSLRQCGFDHARYSSKLLNLFNTRYPANIEQLPFVKLHLAYSLKNAGMYEYGRAAKDDYEHCFLASHPSVYDVQITDAYAITHVIFFLTDFARQESECFSADDYDHFSHLLPRLLEYYVRRQNWDLTAEMLVCMKALSLQASPAYIDAWLLLLASQNEDGSFTGPESTRSTPPKSASPGTHVESGDRKLEYFSENYHTTLVALLALLVAAPAQVY